MSDLVERLRATTLDKDNFPRMKCEKWLPIGLAIEAADEIERLLELLTLTDMECDRYESERNEARAKNERLRAGWEEETHRLIEARAEIARLRLLVKSLADDLEDEIEARYHGLKDHLRMAERYERDMESVHAARVALVEQPLKLREEG